MSDIPIGDHALLSDCQSAALVTMHGSIDWLCFPRFDSPATFARLLGEEAGHWSIRPTLGFQSARRYVDRTMVLETTFRTEGGGELTLTDALALGAGTTGHGVGHDVPHLLLRKLTCTRGSVDVMIEYAPRPEFGLVTPLLSAVDGGVTARGGANWSVLTTPVVLTVDAGVAHATMALAEGESVMFAMHQSAGAEDPARVWSQRALARQLKNTIRGWQSWSQLHQTYQGPWWELVQHSGRVLRALTFAPSGAIVAAVTTSLPEVVGGGRNWDYRYSWVRDASLTMEALWVAACPDEAGNFFTFMATAAAGLGPKESLQIMFGIGGEHDLAERELAHLPGWRDSRPVRIGNGAWNQQQHDVYGELLGAAHRLVDQLSELDDHTRRFLIACADTAARIWREPDQGIWEVRGDPQHYLHSKVMCWVALDRAIALAERIGGEHRIADWTQAAEQIREDVLEQGWNTDAGAFTQCFGSTALDASTLMMAIVGFLPATDPRMLATIDAIAERLTDPHGLVYRYRTERGGDGLAGDEGTFLLCTFWLAQALALAGQIPRARTLFEQAISYLNDVDLLAEEVDTSTGHLLGNFPQAFSHIGLINAAAAIAQAEQDSHATSTP